MKTLLLLLVVLLNAAPSRAGVDPELNLLVTGESAVPFPAWVAGEKLFEEIWKTWEPESRERARRLPADERRRMAFARYGLHGNPLSPLLPMGFVKNAKGRLAFNCLACHSGRVLERTIVGLPNWRIDFRSFFEDLGKLRPLNFPSAYVSTLFGPERGAINALFEVATGITFRDEQMDRSVTPVQWGAFHGAIVNAPPWWNVRKKTHFFPDAFYPVSERIFTTVASPPYASGTEFRAQAAPLKRVLDELVIRTPVPKYPGPVDAERASRGQAVFERACSSCHGTYGENPTYPNRLIPLATAGTDPERLLGEGIRDFRAYLQKSWIGENRAGEVRVEPEGYLAPPLDGVWASAPYFHNGSVPTLHDVLHPAGRPVVWRAEDEGYDHAKMGLSYAAFTEVPPGSRPAHEARKFWDTRLQGRGAQGHLFPDRLDESEKAQVLEYLKTL
jgi:mono/diheme cytochrome c family protein